MAAEFSEIYNKRSLFRSTLNTRALPTGDFRYIRSDYPGNLSDEEGFLTAYVAEHPEVDINIIVPNGENIRKVLASI